VTKTEVRRSICSAVVYRAIFFGCAFLAAVLTMVVLLLPEPVNAANRIKVGSDMVLVIEDSDFDGDTYNGWYSGIKIYKRDQLKAEIDRIDIRSRKLPGSNEIYVDEATIKNFAEGTSFSIGMLTAGNFRAGDFGYLSRNNFSNIISIIGDDFSMQIIDMALSDKRFDISLALFETLPISLSVLPSGHKFIGAGGFKISNLRMIPKSNQLLDLDIKKLRELVKTDYLQFSGAFAQSASLSKGRMSVQTGGRLDIQNVAALALTGEIRVSEAVAEKILAKEETNNPQLEKSLESLLLSETDLVSATIEVQDLGLRGALIQQAIREHNKSKDEVIEASKSYIFQIISNLFPSEGPRLAAGFQQFIAQGGTLTLSLEPTTPIPIAGLMTFFMVPDAAVRHLNVKVRQDD
jgi:hypothetical protein